MTETTQFGPCKVAGKARKNRAQPYGGNDAEMDCDEVLPRVGLDLSVQVESTGAHLLSSGAFDKLSAGKQAEMEAGSDKRKKGKIGETYQIRRIVVPQNRFSQCQKQWEDLYTPLVKHMNLQVRMNLRRRMVELRPSPELNTDMGNLQKGADFVKAFMLGFELIDAIALLRLDDLFVESFQVKDVKKLEGDHLARCIGRISGKDGKTKYAIENATKTRVVISNTNINFWAHSKT
eukprot:CAMPEP_0113845814 /NCGR_PEP_ID=MMETSP0372-20130328/965_1 /TAXON_ID=340204 /ORGANISM="Lankesteria abbotti" /LENGTH=233 /DNA_ID=CAMNT_0000814897 /DNA_START=78 /DNA_END=780 /DNA_ORIENTATION=- /assembly_acc=CAM_ASM_000359